LDLIAIIRDNVLLFLLIITILVYVHEMGHYLVARRCGVKVEVFSIGFGPELWARVARSGTRWRIGAVPLGGYVKMFGDSNAASMPEGGERELTPEEKAVSFHHKSLLQRAAIVVAGPFANFLFAVVVLAGVYMAAGMPQTVPEVAEVQAGTAAERAGFRSGDVIVAIDGHSIERFEDVRRIVALNLGAPLEIDVMRDGERVTLQAQPDVRERDTGFGNSEPVGYLGIRATGEMEVVSTGPLRAVYEATDATWTMGESTLTALWQIVTGARPAQQIGGPTRIADMTGEVVQLGLLNLIIFTAAISVNLGLINLFPVPMLDGGHLMFYAIEAVRGRPLGERAQEIGFRIGLAMVVALMIFATWNDLNVLGLVNG
jgi:regulator of sigma E protease